MARQKYIDYTTSESRSDMPLDKYIEMKLTILQRDFRITLRKSEIDHMRGLKSDIQVDNYARTIINSR